MNQITLFIERLFANLCFLAKKQAGSGVLMFMLMIAAAAITSLIFTGGLSLFTKEILEGYLNLNHVLVSVITYFISFSIGILMYIALFFLSINLNPVEIEYVKNGKKEKKWVDNKDLYYKMLGLIASSEAVSVFYFMSNQKSEIVVINGQEIVKNGFSFSTMLAMIITQIAIVTTMHLLTRLMYRLEKVDLEYKNVSEESNLASNLKHKQKMDEIKAKNSPKKVEKIFGEDLVSDVPIIPVEDALKKANKPEQQASEKTAPVLQQRGLLCSKDLKELANKINKKQ